MALFARRGILFAPTVPLEYPEGKQIYCCGKITDLPGRECNTCLEGRCKDCHIPKDAAGYCLAKCLIKVVHNLSFVRKFFQGRKRRYFPLWKDKFP